MTFKFPRSNRVRLLMLGAALLSLTGGVAVSQVQPMQQTQWDNRRLEQLDRNVRRLERAVTQRNAQGQPVLVEPDPEVVALQGRVGQMDRRLRDIEETFQRVNADVERLTFALDESERENTALRERLGATAERIDTIEQAAAARAQVAAQAQAEAEAAVEAEGASPTGDAVADLAAARALASTDAERGGLALSDVAANWPQTPQGREANWRLGDLRRATADLPGAVQAYAAALAGWPTDGWAGEVTLKLARGLAGTDRSPQACAALGEFDRRYAARASADLRAVAGRVRDEAECEA